MKFRGHALVLGGAIAFGSTAAIADVDGSIRCDPDQSTPRIAKIQKARLSDVIWERQPTWKVSIHFRIGEDGAPDVVDTGRVEVITKRADGDEDVDALKQVAVETLTGFRICVPAARKSPNDWHATLHFTPVARVDSYLQTFTPEYTRDEARHRRQGKVLVRTRYASNGEPAEASVVMSSGDEVLDQKAVSSMLNSTIVTRKGLPLEKAFVFERPYTFEFR